MSDALNPLANHRNRVEESLLKFFGSVAEAERWAFLYDLHDTIEYAVVDGVYTALVNTVLVFREEDWTSPYTVPSGWARARPLPGEEPRPEYIQANLFTLAQIGGAYDLLTLKVEQQHLALLTRWRLDSKAPRALDYIRARSVPHNEREATHA